MRRPALALAAATVLGLMALPSANATPTTAFTGAVLTGLSSAVDHGPTPAATRVQVALTLPRPHEAAELAEYAALYTPGSPQFHHFLSVDQFVSRFGVAPAKTSALKTWATSTGARLVQVSAPGDMVLVDGSAAQIDKLFGVTLHDYSSMGRNYFATPTAPRVPSALGVDGVLGLDSFRGMATQLAQRPKRRSDLPASPRPLQSSCAAPGYCNGLTTPRDMWSTYDMPDSNKGSGQRMAIFGEGKVVKVIEDLRGFEEFNHLPRVNVRVVSVGDDFKSNDGAGEWDIDMQASTGMAPDVAGLDLYFGKSLSDPSVLAVFQKWAGDKHGPLQASASYGECEEAPVSGSTTGQGLPASTASDAFQRKSEQVLRMATMLGKTLFSSTGDTGGSCYYGGANVNGIGNTVVPLISYPGGSPYAVGVGGTVLFTDGNKTHAHRALEYAWEYGGGGHSPFLARLNPDYQAGVVTPDTVCIASSDGTTGNAGKPCRGDADVAAQSGDVFTLNGFAITSGNNHATQGAGTSLSSPLMIGMWARIQAASPTAKGFGFANPIFYDRYRHRTDGTPDFFDVGAGADSPPTGNGQYVSRPGWDELTGVGVPDVRVLMGHVAHRLTPTRPLHPRPTPDPAE